MRQGDGYESDHNIYVVLWRWILSYNPGGVTRFAFKEVPSGKKMWRMGARKPGERPGLKY